MRSGPSTIFGLASGSGKAALNVFRVSGKTEDIAKIYTGMTRVRMFLRFVLALFLS
jgi:hypothetical protein